MYDDSVLWIFAIGKRGEVMDSEQMKELLIKEFEEDPLYKQIHLHRLEGELFTDLILSLHPEGDYSTMDASRILERPDSTIRNHFRSELYNYIAPEKLGKYYRLNYKSIFRLHMIFLLMEKANKTTVDILAYLGMYGIESSYDTRVTKRTSRIRNELEPATNPSVLLRIVKQEKMHEILTHMINILRFENELREIDRQIDSRANERDKAISDLKNQLLEEKQSALLDNYMKAMSQKSRSFVGLFKKREDNIPELRDKIQGLKKKYEMIIKEQAEKFEQEIQELKKEKQKIMAKIEVEKQLQERVGESLEEVLQELQLPSSTIASTSENPRFISIEDNEDDLSD